MIIWNFQVDAQLSPTYNSDIRLYTHKPSFYAYKALDMPLQRELQVLCEALEQEPIHAMLEQHAEKDSSESDIVFLPRPPTRLNK